MNPYKELANAIIVQAVKDYRDAVELLRYTPDDKSAQHDKRSIETVSYTHLTLPTTSRV